jgi:hypothetical protein
MTWAKKGDNIFKITIEERSDSLAQVVKLLLKQHRAWSSNPSTEKKNQLTHIYI